MTYELNIKQKNEMLTLIEQINNGFIKPIVRINNKIYEECFLEANMKARIISCALESKSKTKGEDDLVYVFVLDFSEFAEENKQYAVGDYFDSNRVACLTAEQAGKMPKSLREECFHSITHDDMFFEILDQDRLELFVKYKEEVPENERVNRTYIRWLEDQVMQ